MALALWLSAEPPADAHLSRARRGRRVPAGTPGHRRGTEVIIGGHRRRRRPRSRSDDRRRDAAGPARRHGAHHHRDRRGRDRRVPVGTAEMGHGHGRIRERHRRTCGLGRRCRRERRRVGRRGTRARSRDGRGQAVRENRSASRSTAWRSSCSSSSGSPSAWGSRCSGQPWSSGSCWSCAADGGSVGRPRFRRRDDLRGASCRRDGDPGGSRRGG